MWAQLIKMRAKPGREQDLMALHERIQEMEEPESGLLRTTIGWDQKDPRASYVLVVFESEEKAREREQSPRRQEAMSTVSSQSHSQPGSPSPHEAAGDLGDTSRVGWCRNDGSEHGPDP